MAIFEYSSSNGSSFNLLYECRKIQILDIGDGNQSHISYKVILPYDLQSDTWCGERGYEELNTHYYVRYDCTTTLQGKKCSMI